MVRTGDGVEIILGVKKDPTFGTVIMAGRAGSTAELFGDRALGFPPLNERLARLMLESLKIWPLLQGYRGRPAVDVDGLIEALIRLSYLVADFPEIAELDINPLLVGPDGVLALDARIVVEAAPPAGTKPYAHLALRPYPEEFVRKIGLKDGAEVTLRPIKPEDEPLWMELLASCSPETIYSRFRHFFFWQSHEVATRFCYIDYDREMAIVAETGPAPTQAPGRRAAHRRPRPPYGRIRHPRHGRLAGPGARRHPDGLLPRDRPRLGRPEDRGRDDDRQSADDRRLPQAGLRHPDGRGRRGRSVPGALTRPGRPAPRPSPLPPLTSPARNPL